MIQMPALIWAQMNAAASSVRADRPLQTNIGRLLSGHGNLPGPGAGVNAEWDRRGTGSGGKY